jgi:hypothetical protein
MTGSHCALVRNAVCGSDCTLDIWGRLRSGHGSSAPWLAEAAVASLHHFSARGFCSHSLRIEIHRECSYYLVAEC